MLDDHKPFFEFLSKFSLITEEEFEYYLKSKIQIRKFHKKEQILKPGHVENYFNFILKGLVRKYYRKGKEEINTQISYEGHLILSEESFYSRKPSEFYIEAIEPTTALSITYDDLEYIYSQSQKMEHLGRLVIIQSFLVKGKWMIQHIKLTPRERFLNFVNKSPELIQRVPQKYLASFLNIKPETFSRFKHLIRDAKPNAVS